MKFNLLSKLSAILLLVMFGFFGYKYLKNNNFSQKEDLIQTNPNYYNQQETTANPPDPTSTPASTKETPPQETQSAPEVKKDTIPEKVYLDVPFMVQAPGANWDTVHEDACEEASLAMLYYYITNSSISDPNKDLNGILQFESENGYGPSITLSELNEIAKNYYGITGGKVGTNITINDIKKELASGKPVIVGAAGKILPNPNFRNGGPNYHMLIIIGYDAKGFITNDPGTRLGKDFRYTYEGLFNAIHDWNKNNILDGSKNILVFD